MNYPTAEAPNASRVKREKLGFFHVAYEPPASWSFNSFLGGGTVLLDHGSYAALLLYNALTIATTPVLHYLTASVWLCMVPALYLWAVYTTGFGIVRLSLSSLCVASEKPKGGIVGDGNCAGRSLAGHAQSCCYCLSDIRRHVVYSVEGHVRRELSLVIID